MRFALFLRLSAAVGCILFVIGCSTLPDRPDEVRTARERVGRLTEFGEDYYRRGQYEQARSFYTLAFDLARSVDSLRQIGALHNAIGQTWQAEGDLAAAREEFDQALTLALRSAHRTLEAESRTNLARIELEHRNYGEAEAILSRALEVLENERDVLPQQAVIRHNLAIAFAGLGDLDGGREQLLQARDINDSLNRRFQLAANYYMLASFASRSGDYEQALRYAERALEIDRTMENTRGIMSDLRALYQISLRMNERQQAFEYLDRARSVAAGSSNTAVEHMLLEDLIPLADELDQTHDLRRYQQRYEELDR